MTAERTPEELERHVRRSIRRARWLWSLSGPCSVCGELIGHWGGPLGAYQDDPRPRCSMIPPDVWLDEVRPNCFDVRWHRIGDSIRAACKS